LQCAIIFGGVSFEHEISIVSAISLKDVLDAKITYIFCDAKREFYFIPTKDIKSKLFSSGEYKKYPKLILKNGGFFQKTLFGEKKLEFEFAINLIHGADGEDGKMASLLTFFGIDFIGPRVEASVISFNKLLTKSYAKERGVKVFPYEVLRKGEYKTKMEFPIIIKPLRLGSSIGISIVKEESELSYALDVAYEFDHEVLIEPFIDGVKEYNLAGVKGDKFIFSIVEEPQKEQFLDFDKKYLDFSRTSKVQKADINVAILDKIEENFAHIYENFFEGSLIRCDFFEVEGEVYLNEINPIPGSMANYLFEDFTSVIKSLSTNLPNKMNIPITYQYIDSIQKAKGK